MKQKILVAFDSSDNAMRAVEFVARSFPTDNEVTLYHVLQDTAVPGGMHSPELTDYFISAQRSFRQLEEQWKKLAEEAMERAKTVLAAAGFPDANIRTRIEIRRRGIARDILAESEKGYQMIVIGRRGLSAIAEFFIGSVSQKVMNAARNIAVVIVN